MIDGIRSLYSVAVCSGDEQERSSAVPYAISLAAAARAHLTVQCAAIRLVLPSAASSGTIAGLVSAENRRIAQLAEQLSSAARADAEAAGVACAAAAIHAAHLEVMSAVARQSRVHDLTIVDAGQGVLDSARSLAEAALFEGGRPALIVPPRADVFKTGRAIVAWDGSAMASRAVAAALPLLRAAEMVEVLSISGEKDLSRAVPGAELATHLAHHGVNVDVKELAVGQRAAADVLRDQANMFGADLIVMGAFKHSRLRQWILGGLTSSMLDESPAALLMSH